MPIVVLIFVALGFLILQALIGGVRMVYGLPAYTLLGVAALLSVVVPWRRAVARPSWICLGVTVAWVGYICWRAFNSPVEYLARYDLYMALGAALVYLIFATHLTKPGHRMTVIAVLMVFSVLHVISGALQFRNVDDYMMIPWIRRPPQYLWRASGFYICPNHLAGLLEMLAMFSLAFLCWARGRTWVRMLMGYTVLMCIAGLAITGSRGGYLSFGTGLIVFTLLSMWAVKRVRPEMFGKVALLSVVTFTLLVGGALGVMAKSDLIKRRLDMVYDPTNMRLQLWEASLEQFQLEPLIGTGSGTYFYYGRQFRHESVQNDPQHVHNDYLELLAEYGIVGAALCLVFLVSHFASGWSGLKRIVREKLRPAYAAQSNELALVVGGLSAAVAITAHSVIDFNLHIPANTVFVALIFAILANPAPSLRAAASGESKFARGLLRWLAPAAGVAVIALSVPRIEGEYWSERSRAALRDRQYDESVAFAHRGLAVESANYDLFYYLGEAQHFIAMRYTNPEEQRPGHEFAALAYEEGLKLFPNDLRLLLKLGRTYDNLRRFPEAEAIFKRAIAADPNFGNVYAYYGAHKHLTKDYEEAQRLYIKARAMGESELSKVGLETLPEELQRAYAVRVRAELIDPTDVDSLEDLSFELRLMEEKEEPMEPGPARKIRPLRPHLLQPAATPPPANAVARPQHSPGPARTTLPSGGGR